MCLLLSLAEVSGKTENTNYLTPSCLTLRQSSGLKAACPSELAKPEGVDKRSRVEGSTGFQKKICPQLPVLSPVAQVATPPTYSSGIVYAGNKEAPQDSRAYLTLFAGLIGGLTGMSYTTPVVDNTYQPPIVRRGSLAASVGFAGTVAGFGFAASRISNGQFSGGILSYLAGLCVGSAMYYAQ